MENVLDFPMQLAKLVARMVIYRGEGSEVLTHGGYSCVIERDKPLTIAVGDLQFPEGARVLDATRVLRALENGVCSGTTPHRILIRNPPPQLFPVLRANKFQSTEESPPAFFKTFVFSRHDVRHRHLTPRDSPVLSTDLLGV